MSKVALRTLKSLYQLNLSLFGTKRIERFVKKSQLPKPML